MGSLTLPDEDAAGGVPVGTVDCDCCANAPVARMVQSASEPIPSTFSVEPIVYTSPGGKSPLQNGWRCTGIGCRRSYDFRFKTPAALMRSMR